jgi:hypothetical protein
VKTEAPEALLVGGLTLVGGIVVGKIVVDAIHGRLPETPSGAPGPLDQSVRLVASLLGLTVTLVQLPNAWNAAQELVREGF